MELDELEVGQGGARGLREQETVAHGAAGVRGPRPERGVAAGREDDGGAAQRAERRDALALDDPDPWMPASSLCENVRDEATGVCAAGMHDTGAGVAALPCEAVVEPHAEPAQLRDPLGSLLRQQPDRAGPAEAAPRGERVGCVERGIVARADGCRDSSLGGVAVRARVGGLREHEHRGARLGRSEGSGEAGDTGSDDDHVRSLAFLPHNR